MAELDAQAVVSRGDGFFIHLKIDCLVADGHIVGDVEVAVDMAAVLRFVNTNTKVVRYLGVGITHGVAGDRAAVERNIWYVSRIIAGNEGDTAAIFIGMVIGNLTAVHNKLAAATHIHTASLSLRDIIGDFAAIYSECAAGHHDACAVII